MKHPLRFLALSVVVMFWGCGGAPSPQARPSPPKPITAAVETGTAQESTQSRLEFFPTANRTRQNIAASLKLPNWAFPYRLQIFLNREGSCARLDLINAR